MNKEEIELYFYNLLRGKISIIDFEEWVYDLDEELIDKYFGTGFYFELANLNYKNKYVINEVEKLLFGAVPLARFEELKIKGLLESLIEKENNLIDITEELYELYCKGYSFLRYLGLSYITHYESENYNEQSIKSLVSEAKRIGSFLDSGKIVITGDCEFKDYREDYEKIESNDLEKMYIEPKQGIILRVINKICRMIR